MNLMTAVLFLLTRGGPEEDQRRTRGGALSLLGVRHRLVVKTLASKNNTNNHGIIHSSSRTDSYLQLCF